MTGRLRDWLETLGEAFWLRPALLVALAALLGEAAVMAERAGWRGEGLLGRWAYAGGTEGARAVLETVASAAIGVAGTVFSITIAALSLASSQMGPRLLRNFVRDAGNQLALGVFLGSFAFCLVVLRSVRTMEEGAFVPHLGVTAALLLALACVATLVWFVHHTARGISVETVLELVHQDIDTAIARMTGTAGGTSPREIAEPPLPATIRASGRGYLRSLDEAALADWAARQGAVILLSARPGDYLLPGLPVARASTPEAAVPIAAAMSLGPRQAAAQDLEFALRQMVEVALRALSPGVNDPFTAVGVLDRLAAALGDLAGRDMPAPWLLREGRPVLRRRVSDHAGICDAMFDQIRQCAAGNAAVLIRLVEALGRVLAVERDAARRATLLRHAALATEAGRRGITEPAARAALEARHAALPMA